MCLLVVSNAFVPICQDGAEMSRYGQFLHANSVFPFLRMMKDVLGQFCILMPWLMKNQQPFQLLQDLQIQLPSFGAARVRKLEYSSANADAYIDFLVHSGDLLSTLEGHTDRLARIAFHPMGRHMVGWSFSVVKS